MNKLRKIILVTVLFVMAFSWSSFSQYVVGDYGSIASSSWSLTSTWGRYDGVTPWVAAGSVPTVSDNAFILSGTIVDVPSSSSSSNCKNLTVESGAQLWTNNTTINQNGYVNVYGNIDCEGIIGNGVTYDNISFNIEGANDTISGAGTFDASRIRKSGFTNATTNLVINKDVNLRFYAAAPNGGTAIYNNTPIATFFNVTVATGSTLTLDSTGSNLSSASIDGIDGGVTANLIDNAGTFTINGTMDVQGRAFFFTNNAGGSTTCKWVINGELKVYDAFAGTVACGNAKDSVSVNSGGKLNLTGTPAFSALNFTNNLFSFNTGSTVEYSAQGAQTVKTGTDFGGAAISQYYNLNITGSGTKTTSASGLSIKNNLTISNVTGSPVLNPNAQQITIGGDWTNYNKSGFSKTGNQLVTFAGGQAPLPANTQTITCPGGENFHRVTLNKGGLANTWFLRLNDDIEVDSILLFSNTPDRAALDLNGHKLSLNNPINGALVGIFDAANSRYIVSETAVGTALYATNPSIIQWRMGTSAAAYVFPFGVNGSYLPVTIGKKATAVIDTVKVSTRATSTRDNRPWDDSTNVSQVATMSSLFVPGGLAPNYAADTSVIDRWWDIVPSSILAVDSLKFTYRGSENTLDPLYQTGSVFPQNWDGTDWKGRILSPFSTGVTAGTATVISKNDTLNGAPWVISSFNRRLPINLLEFTATLKNSQVDVTWSTASEINNSYFTVERSRDGQHFIEVKRVPGNGTSSTMHYYSTTDPSPFSGLSYYRLRQTDYDGHFTVSDMVPVFNEGASTGWFIFPNPATDKINIANTNNHDFKGATFQLLNSEGSLVKTIDLNTKNQSVISIDVHDLSNGIYIGKITDDYSQEVFKIVKN